MTREVPLRDDTPAYALLLEAAHETYARLDGSRTIRIHDQIEQFLCNPSPDAALEDPQKFPDPLRQLKDRNAKLRGLGVHCHGDNYDLLIVQVLYDRDNQDKYTLRSDRFASRGERYRDQYHDIDHETLQPKIEEWAAASDKSVFRSEVVC